MNQESLLTWASRALIAVCVWLFLDLRSDVKEIKEKLEQAVMDVAVLKSQVGASRLHSSSNPMPFLKPKEFRLPKPNEQV